MRKKNAGEDLVRIFNLKKYLQYIIFKIKTTKDIIKIEFVIKVHYSLVSLLFPSKTRDGVESTLLPVASLPLHVIGSHLIPQSADELGISGKRIF